MKFIDYSLKNYKVRFHLIIIDLNFLSIGSLEPGAEC